MHKDTYYYNSNTLEYEKVKKTWGQRIWQLLGFLIVSLFFAFVTLSLGYTFFTPPAQANLEESLKELDNNYLIINKKIDYLSSVLNEIEGRDDQIYRVIFESDPLPSLLRKGSNTDRQKFKELSKSSKSDIIKTTLDKIQELERRIYVQSKSFDQLESYYKNRHLYLEAIPAIQPIANEKLKRIASGFGSRIHPIYKTRKSHTGIDFTAPSGTEIYATGNGIVTHSGNQGDGYGNKVIINHGYGYETLYGHCSRVLVRKGQKVKRGQKIALVGNTGQSSGPHLHYEVIRNDVKINPVNFFFNDLTPEEYNQVLILAEQDNQSLD